MVVTLTGSPARVRSQEVSPPAAPRSVGVGYALSIGGLLAPMYLAKAISNSEGDIGLPARAAMLAGICWGPSLGFGYGRAYQTALVSGLIKTAIVAGRPLRR